jgi:hypothetical protein
MGDRVSISFKTGKEESVVLFNHWGGKEFASEALDYAQDLMDIRTGEVEPLDRFEPNTVMVDFIRHITKTMARVESSLYLGKDQNDGDNSDNGHFVILFDVKKRRVSFK